jgi:hypothetical protein
MATVNFFKLFFNMGTEGLTPGSTIPLWFGPADVFKTGAISVTGHAGTLTTGGTGSVLATQQVQVSDVRITTQLIPGPLPDSEVIVNAEFTNVGSATIRELTVSIGVVSP